MIFHVGQRVVCINVLCRGGSQWPGYLYPQLNAVYTVRDIYANPCDGRTLLRLAEIKNPPLPSGNEPGFGATHFRPVTECKTDISIFKKILDDASKKRELRVVD